MASTVAKQRLGGVSGKKQQRRIRFKAYEVGPQALETRIVSDIEGKQLVVPKDTLGRDRHGNEKIKGYEDGENEPAAPL